MSEGSFQRFGNRMMLKQTICAIDGVLRHAAKTHRDENDKKQREMKTVIHDILKLIYVH